MTPHTPPTTPQELLTFEQVVEVWRRQDQSSSRNGATGLLVIARCALAATYVVTLVALPGLLRAVGGA
jgi:hypothetical protein